MMDKNKFWRTALAISLCMIFLWLGFCSWNWAFELSARTNLPVKAFDVIAWSLGFMGFLSICIVNEWKGKN